MNIIEAINTGLPMRRRVWYKHTSFIRKHSTYWQVSNSDSSWVTWEGSLKPDDIVANDWVVGEEKIEVTRDILQKAITKWLDSPIMAHDKGAVNAMLHYIKEECK